MKGRILVVEDDDLFAAMLEETLQRKGFQTILARDGREALTKYVPGGVDLVITDLVMPEVEGLELIRELRTMDKRVRIIAISGSMRALPKTFLPIAQHFGALRTLEKPFSAQELLELIEEVLASGGDACER